tara:strand:+ start:625 stop:1065 length:441 start_codon:yes stop_codon:yes gene_type:complete
MEKIIQFVANYEDWQAIKKLKVEEKTTPKMVMEFLTSLGVSLDNKIEVNLRKTVDLDRLDTVLSEISYGKTEEEIATALKALNSRAVTSVIKEITELEALQKNERKELNQFCKVYAARKALKNCGLNVDYSSVNVPGMKRKKEKKV